MGSRLGLGSLRYIQRKAARTELAFSISRPACILSLTTGDSQIRSSMPVRHKWLGPRARDYARPSVKVQARDRASTMGMRVGERHGLSAGQRKAPATRHVG